MLSENSRKWGYSFFSISLIGTCLLMDMLMMAFRVSFLGNRFSVSKIPSCVQPGWTASLGIPLVEHGEGIGKPDDMAVFPEPACRQRSETSLPRRSCTSDRVAQQRESISFAALRVKVKRRIELGVMPLWTRWRTRYSMTRVLPEPAPAMTEQVRLRL